MIWSKNKEDRKPGKINLVLLITSSKGKKNVKTLACTAFHGFYFIISKADFRPFRPS
jgi:hypothetical protein